MSSEFNKAIEDLDSRKCKKCHGSGSCDDADLGDISFYTWTCPDCKGSGFTPTNAKIPT